MRRYYIILLVLGVFCLSNLALGLEGEPKLIKITREIQATVTDNGQKQVLIVPSDPLSFDTTLNWELTLAKKSLAAEKEAAFFLIEAMNGAPRQIERRTISGSGSLKIPKGAQYKITIAAGEYSLLILKTGNPVKLRLTYDEAIIKATQGDQPYQFGLEVEGPLGLNTWNWLWGGKETSSGTQVNHQFASDGKLPIVVEGKGKTASGATTQSYYFELYVPPLIVLEPKVGPLQGSADLQLAVQVSAILNYGQKATYYWNFGNGIEVSGSQASNTYNIPGKYQLVLTAKVGNYTFDRNWLITVAPLTVVPNLVLTPRTGPVPLEVNGLVNPSITGGPTKLKVTWDIDGTIINSEKFNRTFTEPGDYRVLLKISDGLHPDLLIPEEVLLIKATPPQMTLKPTVSIAKGLIPLATSFKANLEVVGAPVELVYHWDFGDGEVSFKDNPSHVFKRPGTYQVQIVVSDRLHPGNLAMANLPVEVLPPELKLTATANPVKGLLPLAVFFNSQVAINGSPCELQYRWDFGNGDTSMEQNPTYVYHQEGKYNVTLEVRDRLHPGNNVQTSLQMETKTPRLRLTAAVNPNSGIAPLTVQCHAWADKEGAPNAKLKYIWEFGDGEKAEGTDQTHTFKHVGTYTVVVTVVDEQLGITEEKTFKVTVKQPIN